MFNKKTVTGVVLFGLCLLAGYSALGDTNKSNQDAIIFKLGSFDRSSFEFASDSPKQPVNFVVGQSDPAKEWYATQPAVLSSASVQTRADVPSAPRAIRFSIDTTPGGTYRLRASLLIEAASVPALRIDINGRRGMLYLHPKLDYSNGDQGDSFYPAFSHAETTLEFPANYLKRGENTITFQVVEQADQAVPDASLTYDAIELDHVTGAGTPNASSALIVPTIFFRQESGSIKEQVDIFIQSARSFKTGDEVELAVNGKTYRQTVPGNQDLGEEKLSFLVPEFTKDTHAQLTWKSDGHPQHSDQTINPQKKWTIFIVPHIHVDVGYSDYQPKVAAIQSRDIDEALDMIDQNPNFRYSLDGAWDLEQFLKTHTAADQARAIKAVQEKKLYVPAQYANLLTGFPTSETLIRSLYPSANFSREHGSPFNYANITDVPSYSWSYASVLAAAGIHYLAGGSNNYRAPVLLQCRLNENSPMWWEGPDGSKVLLWYSRIYQQMQMIFGLPPVLDAGRDTLPLFLQMYEHPGYVADETIMYGTQVENTDLFPQQSQLAQKWNETYAYPHLKYSGFYDALQSIQQQFGSNIPTIRGDGGPYWEDGIASDAYYAGMERWNEGRAPTAEKFATLTSIVNPHTRADKGALDRMWRNMVLMDEHTWDSYNSISDSTSMEAVKQLAVKDQYAVNAQALADFITQNTMASLTSAIPVGAGKVIIFNSLSWKRSGLVSIDIDKKSELVDTTTDQKVPFKILQSGPNFDHIQFVATDIPAVGYKVYKMQPSTSPSPITATQQSLTMENSYYRVTLDPSTGAVKSIYDKQLNHELVNESSPYRFGQYLYVTGGDKAPNTILQYSHVYPKPALEVHPAEGGSLVSVSRMPYGWVARMQSRDLNTPAITSEIRLFNRTKKIEFVEDVEKKDVDTKEGVYFAFPFAMNHPEFKYEVQNGVVNPVKDMYPGAGHEWFSVQHWIALQEGGVSVSLLPLDAGLATFGDINRGEWPDHFGDRPGSVFSYIMNNYWDTNYRAGQGGHFKFHYVLTSASSTNASELSRLGWEEITPLEADIVTTQDKALSSPEGEDHNASPSGSVASSGSPCILDPKEDSFLNVDDPNVLFETWKPAEDGNGTILRFLDMGGDQRTVTVRVPLLHIEQAWQGNAVEKDGEKLSLSGDHAFSFVIHPHEIASIRIVGSDACKVD
ncbi:MULTISPECIES: polysaccharide lyase family protein [Acidobacteriaceae]|uniref:glycoside hydrolase family 38 N-terminal domain-containing protein n=1 Tax=Acidobacteriaceae TaxID=204434 RepID=UPI0020B108F8|nr:MULTISPECIES: polysaccharide lyase family protein [Acidobacteriaceae]MDW5265377.1 polysaccharide lyase family protein [Edaphobacter sp.]